VKDYDYFAITGFVASTWILPAMIVPKEFSIGQEDMDGVNFEDHKSIEAFFQKCQKKMCAGWDSVPYIREGILGNLMEMIDRRSFQRIY